MKFTVGSLVAASLLFPAAVLADEGHEHHADLQKLGAVHFPVACRPETQVPLERGVALLHSFAYEPAGKAFAEIARQDAGCAMASWGLAMSNLHPIWAPPTPEEFQAGRAAAEKAAAMGGATPREGAYIAAIAAFYRGDDRPHVERMKAFEQGMAKTAVENPADHEAAIFRALAILGVAYSSPPDKTYAHQKEAAAILNGLLAAEPNHPGIAHYLIHSFDFPALAELALPAARRYAEIAPDAPHALHMPSHIFTRLGLWPESIASNLASAATAGALVAKNHPGATAFDALHAMDYLEYAYLQGAEDAKARDVAARAAQVRALDSPSFAAGYALAAIPARLALERRDWQAAATLSVPAATFPWEKYPYAEALTQFGRALGAARSGDLPRAREAVARLTAIQSTLAQAPRASYDWATQVEIQRRTALGWLRHAEKKDDEALALLRSAADLEDSTDKHPVTPGQVLPAREQLADLLLETGQAPAAREEYEATLKTAPRRFRSLAGAARAAELAGDPAGARVTYAQLVELCARADSERPELKQARAFLAKAPAGSR